MQFDEASRALVELAASRHNAFHTLEAAEINITDRRLRRAAGRGEIYRLAPAVWAISGIGSSPKQTLRAAVLSVPASAATLESAVWLHGWMESAPPTAQVWAPPNRRSAALATTFRAAQVEPLTDIVLVDGIRTLNKAATLCLLGTVAHPTVVERCLDAFLLTESEGWLNQTLLRFDARKPKGPQVLRDILASPHRTRGVAESWMERVTTKLISLPWMPELVLQHPVEVRGRRFRIDIACPDLKLGIEAHSRTYHFGPSKEDADNVRDLLLASAGWDIVYVTYSQLRRPSEFTRLFAQMAKARARQLGVSL